MTKLSDTWQTPQWLFDELSREHGPFDIDLCATAENSKCVRFCKDYLNGIVDLENHLKYYLVKGYRAAFMNPPYSNPLPFVEKAWEDSKHCKIVLLLKVDTSTKWWSVFWNYTDKRDPTLGITGGAYSKVIEKAGPKPGCDYKFLPKRAQFDPPQQLIDSGDVWKGVCSGCDNKNIGVSKDVSYCRKCQNKGKHKWVQKCNRCRGDGRDHDPLFNTGIDGKCATCKGAGYTALSGPTFPSAIIIMDRRGL